MMIYWCLFEKKDPWVFRVARCCSFQSHYNYIHTALECQHINPWHVWDTTKQLVVDMAQSSHSGLHWQAKNCSLDPVLWFVIKDRNQFWIYRQYYSCTNVQYVPWMSRCFLQLLCSTNGWFGMRSWTIQVPNQNSESKIPRLFQQYSWFYRCCRLLSPPKTWSRLCMVMSSL